jgi:hypothetical protein
MARPYKAVGGPQAKDPDGNSQPLLVNADGELLVSDGGGGGGGGTSSNFGDAFPAAGTAIGVSDPGGDMVGLAVSTLDFDTGGGTVPQAILGIALPASGGPVAGGTATNPINVVSAAPTATLTNVNDTASSTTLLSLNLARRGAYIFNDSTVALYVKLGTTASLTDFTVKVNGGAYYELPFPVYTGRIDGIWASDASGAARMTEVT